MNTKAGLGSSNAALASLDTAGMKDHSVRWRKANERYHKITVASQLPKSEPKDETNEYVDMFVKSKAGKNS